MHKQAQSILEYVIVLTAIVAAFIAAARGPVTTAVNNMFRDATNVMSTQTGNFAAQAGVTGQNSH